METNQTAAPASNETTEQNNSADTNPVTSTQKDETQPGKDKPADDPYNTTTVVDMEDDKTAEKYDRGEQYGV